jgi:dipeptidyl aminopeptidase/acylaminoacyl peptidase
MMKQYQKMLSVLAACMLILAAVSPLAAQDTLPAVTWRDVAGWKQINGGSVSMSNDGQWFAYFYTPNKGDSQLILKHTTDTINKTWNVGDVRGGLNAIQFNADATYLAFTVYPTEAVREKAPRNNPPENNMTLVNLSNWEELEFSKVKGFSFSGENPSYLAVHLNTPKPAANDKEAGKGTDLLLYNLQTKSQLSLGNVSSYEFNKNGKWLAWIVDSYGKTANGIQFRNMLNGSITSPENAKASYLHLSWTDEGDALTAVKVIEDEGYEENLHVILAFTDFDKSPRKIVYDPREDEGFPEGMAITAARRPSFSEDLSSLYFGIHEVTKKEKPQARGQQKGRQAEEGDKDTDPDKEGGEKETDQDKKDGADKEDVKKEGDEPAKDIDASKKEEEDEKKEPAPKKNTEDKPDVVIWHWNDSRLQSVQQNRERNERNSNYLSTYNLKTRQFVRLADEEVNVVVAAPKDRFAIGYDNSPYELQSSLSGENYRDIYRIDIKTGERKKIIERILGTIGANPTPDGNYLLFYRDGHYHSYNLLTDQVTNLTEIVPSSFINQNSDINVEYAPTPAWGFSSDSKHVLIRDNHDLWKISVDGRKFENLTQNGKEKNRMYHFRFRLEENEKGIDLSQPLYVRFMDLDTKKTGIARIDKGKPGAKVLLHDDAILVSLSRAKDSDTYYFTRETNVEPPNYYISFNKDLKDARKITDIYPEQASYAWTPGSRLFSYVSARGDTLQAALFLPAGYQEGESYPTVVYIYERLTQDLNSYARPTFPGGGFNRAMYTSNGYAVLMPDIAYELNDPGMSAVWCVLPALDAAIETGIVDAENVAIHGHSWGGYQTAFLITQTDRFKAAVAGAALTNMISMYSLIYWNTGTSNQAIFESSQGRFTSGYWDNWDAYKRNSPIFYAQNVNTPLLLMHNDKDGAVDFTQGVEYYNTLRRLRKPVVMLQYEGENHGLTKLPNRIDYALRMMEFLDHHLKGAEAPEWWTEGVPHLKKKEHLEARPTTLTK